MAGYHLIIIVLACFLIAESYYISKTIHENYVNIKHPMLQSYSYGARSVQNLKHSHTTKLDYAATYSSGLESIAAQQKFPLPKLTTTEVNDLNLGKLIEKQQRYGRKGYGSVVVDLPASVNQVYDTLANIRSYDRLIKTIKSVKVYKENDSSIFAEFCLSRFLLKINVIHTFDPVKNLIKFSLDPNRANPVIHFVDGFWYLEELPRISDEDRTTTRLWFNVKLEVNHLVPNFIVDYAACRALPRATRWIQPYFMNKLRQS